MKKMFSLFFVAFLASVFSFSAFAFDTPSDSVILTGETYNSKPDYMNSLNSIGGSVPSDYTLLAYCSQTDYYTSSTRVTYFYGPSSVSSVTAYIAPGGSLHVDFPTSVYYVANRFTSEGDQLTISGNFGSTSSFGTSGRTGFQFVSFLSVYDNNGVLTPLPSRIPFDLNTLLIDHNLYFNASTDNDVATLLNGVDFYVFPSSFPVTSTPTTVNSNVSVLEVSPSWAFYRDRHFSPLISGFERLVNENVTHIPMILNASYTRSTPLNSFNPDGYSLPYEYLGKWLLFTTGSELASDVRSYKFIDLKSVSRTGVWANSSLCLVATWQHDGLYSVARWDFNIDSILTDTAVVPSGHSHFTPAPSVGSVSDLQQLADYLNDLADNRVENDNIFLNNLLSGLNTMPWANYMAGGINNALPNLSFMLDSLFESLFDKFTAPSQDQINSLMADIDAERTSLRAKLAFVDDVKTEYYFVISTITADDNSVPPDFEFSLPSMWSGGETIKVKLVTYQIATPEIMSNIKQILSVFLSLALMLHIWRTLPATVGNMPRGDV